MGGVMMPPGSNLKNNGDRFFPGFRYRSKGENIRQSNKWPHVPGDEPRQSMRGRGVESTQKGKRSDLQKNGRKSEFFT